jgi:glycosyltransferase involved in cell wall biosynthesis
MLVSVYLPTRNRVALLARAVDSVLAQTHRELELIVVDDASSGGTEAYLLDKVCGDSRLSFLRNHQWRGAAVSRNRAIRASKGVFVTGLDDDDYFEPTRLAAFVDRWERLRAAGDEPSFLYTQIALQRDGRITSIYKQRPVVRYEDMFEANQIGNQIFAPRDRYFESGLFDETLPAWQDLEFFMRILQKFGPAYLLEQTLYVADQEPRSDRISRQEHVVRAAYAAVAGKHAGGDRARRLSMFVNQFQSHYGFGPRLTDWREYFRFGAWPRGFARMLLATVEPHWRRATFRR